MIATMQQQSCYMPWLSGVANPFDMPGNDKDLIEALVEWSGLTITGVARKAGLAVTTLTRPANIGVSHRLSLPTMDKLRASFPDFPQWQGGQGGSDSLDTVGIQHIDMAYGLGATFAVDHPEVEVLQFPRAWIATITHSPPAMLTWTRGKGDSMEPTIRDGDLILLDRSQRALTERDAMWAFTLGEEAAIKRLRRQGDRCQIFSDNASVPVDEQNLMDMNIVGRVVFVGSRK